jgi:hypothetical protein
MELGFRLRQGSGGKRVENERREGVDGSAPSMLSHPAAGQRYGREQKRAHSNSGRPFSSHCRFRRTGAKKVVAFTNV